jgi:hypothetical protein
MIRSEHPQDYAGVSGLLYSYPVDDLMRRVMKQNRYNRRPDFFQALSEHISGDGQEEFEEKLKILKAGSIQRFCELTGENEVEFMRDTSYSYWEKINGYNRTVVADNAVPGRYHVFSSQLEEDPYNNYSTLKNGKIESSGSLLTDDLREGMSSVVDFYESVRGLGNFDPNHCPILEVQTDLEGRHHFLQYHRGRDLEPRTFELPKDRTVETGEVEAMIVRGATPPEGRVVQTALFYPGHTEGTWAHKLPETDEGSLCNIVYDGIFTELMLRRRAVHFVCASVARGHDKDHMVNQAADAHLPKSTLFKPEISVLADYEGMGIDDAMMNKLGKETEETGVAARVPLWVLSDGKRAIVKSMP